MSEPTTLAELLGPVPRACRACGQEVPVTLETWPHLKGKPVGRVCRPCEKARLQAKDENRKVVARAAKATAELAAQKLPVGRPSAGDRAAAAILAARSELSTAKDSAASPPIARLEIAHALKQGARVLNENAEMVLTRVLEYADDVEHPHHLWALQLLAERTLPRKLFEELGAAAAGVGGPTDKRPVFVVNVLPAVAPQREGIAVSAAITVQAIEERPDERLPVSPGNDDGAGIQKAVPAADAADGRAERGDFVPS